MKKSRKRYVEKGYPTAVFVSKLRRFADAGEAGEPFAIQIAGKRIPGPARATSTIEHEKSAAEEEIGFKIRWADDWDKATLFATGGPP